MQLDWVGFESCSNGRCWLASLLAHRTISSDACRIVLYAPLELLRESLHRFWVAVKACSADATAGSIASVASSKSVQASSWSEDSPAALPRSDAMLSSASENAGTRSL
jgi:hypothetical protein